MLQIIAINITNLTDARYFSARGAQWLFYKLESIDDIPKIKAIIPWVDGPKFGIMTNLNWKEEELSFIIDQLQPAALLEEVPTEIKPEVSRFLMSKSSQDIINDNLIVESENLENSSEHAYLFKKIWPQKDIDQIQDINLKGLVFSGGKENKPGLKNFESIDKVLDKLEEINYG